jgi:hypothetical protein
VAGRLALGLLLIACAATARGGDALEATATATVGERVATLHLEVRNAGDAAVSEIVPEVVYQGRDEHGAPLPALAPATGHTWTFDLPIPAAPGTVPAVVRVRYTDGDGRRAAVPTVATVSTPGLLPMPEVRATLTTSPVTHFARALLVLENPTSAPLHGRVVVVLPDGLEIEPESQPAEIPADGRSAIPLVLQNRGAPSGATVPIFALFEYELEGRRELAVASAGAVVVGGAATLRPLVVGAAALGAALAVLALAWRAAARRAHRQS